MTTRPPEIVLFPGPDGPVRVLVWPAVTVGSRRPGKTLLALHGWTDSADVFQNLASALDPRHAVVAIDAPGHGGTPLPPGDYVIADHARAAVAVLDSLQRLLRRSPGKVVAYGHSMGALTATRIATARPGRVSGLVLEEPARTTLRRPAAVASMRTWLLGLRSGDHAARVAWLQANHPDWPQDELDAWASSKAAVDLAEFDRRHDWGEPLPALLSDVHCPTWLIRGEPARGGIVSARAAARCEAACPGGLTIVVLDAGHSPRREAPEAFVGCLARALAPPTHP